MDQDYTLMPALLWYKAFDQSRPKANIRVDYIVKNESLDLAFWNRCLAILEKTMPLKPMLCSVLFLVSAYGCDKSSSIGDDGTDGETAGGGSLVNTELLALSIDNVRASAEQLTSVNMVTAEIFRTLKPFLYSTPPAADFTMPAALASLIPVNLDEQFAESNQAGLPLDPYDNFSCSVIDSGQPPFDPLVPEAGIEFRDLDSNDALSDGDQVVFSYVVDGSCRTDSVDANVPTSLSGIIEFTFTGESDFSSTPRRLVGVATFYNYQVDAGIASDTVQSGTVDFDLEFTNGTTNRATFESASVTLAGLDATILTAPLDITFDLIERELNPAGGVFVEGNYNTVLDGVTFSSAADAKRLEYQTIGYPDPASTDQTLFGQANSYPQTGAIAIVGGNETAGLVRAQPGGEAVTDVVVDTSGNGLFVPGGLFEPTSWSEVLGGFLIPSP